MVNVLRDPVPGREEEGVEPDDEFWDVDLANPDQLPSAAIP